eukprot:TRINITY_DN12813_c0_g1_i2.p1 TRINITY_DN12813_c0_g1~~TRINITY_DN12813_c0_g1_i2.p1  ORF type:complete len:302 (+),score=67.15 TRINITY_DN12813_c0_g1_i2:48-908(+)
MAAPIAPDAAFAALSSDDVKQRMHAVRALYSVSHCAEIRALAAVDAPSVARSLAAVAEDAAAASVMWETLALVAQLCWTESKARCGGEAARASQPGEVMARALVQVDGFEGTLKAVRQARLPADVVAKELLAALPFGGGEWSTARRDRCHDLAFVDPRLSEPWPRVTRALSAVCLNCGEPTTTPPLRCSACQAVYYCSSDCSKQHWKLKDGRGHKERCKMFAAQDRDSPLSNASELFVPTRAQLYAARAGSLRDVDFAEYFFEYTQPRSALPADLTAPGRRPDVHA